MAIIKPVILEGGQLKTAGVGDQVPQSFVDGLETSLGSKASKTELTTGLGLKVDKVTGKGLSDTNYTQAEKDKLSSLDDSLDSKVDKVTGKGLSDTNFTQEEKDKLSSLESSKFIGLFASESALPATGSDGEYANVDGGVGSDVYRVLWDSSDNKWAKMQGVATELTPAQIKQQYEGNPDTNAFTDDEKVKLTGIAVDATKNRTDSENADKLHTHTVEQVDGLDTTLESKVDKVTGKGLSESDYTTAEKTKLADIAPEATKNRDDSENADKLHTHTVEQVAGLSEALENKVDTSSVVQTTGTSTTHLMSQAAITAALSAGGNTKPSNSVYTYDSGLVIKITDDGRLDTVIDYHESGTVNSITYPDGRIETFSYDSLGNVTSMTASGG